MGQPWGHCGNTMETIGILREHPRNSMGTPYKHNGNIEYYGIAWEYHSNTMGFFGEYYGPGNAVELHGITITN